MKKLALLATLAIVFTTGFNAKADWDEVGEAAMWYLPNRIVDMVDMVNLSLGAGPCLRAEVRATRAFSFGAGVGCTAEAVKGANRQYGGALESGWDASFTCIAAENTDFDAAGRYLKSYMYDEAGIPTPSEDMYNYDKGKRTYWGIGGRAGVGVVQLGVEIDPVEVADFILGWFCVDIKGDDY